MADAARILSLLSTGEHPGAAWLDGGAEARSFLGLRPDLEIEADDLEALERIDALWRGAAEHLWIGWITYDLGADEILGRTPVPRSLPGLVFRRYPAALEIRPGEPVTIHGDATVGRELQRELDERAPLAPTDWGLSPLRAELDPAVYRERVAKIREHIADGHTYQVNLSQRFFAAHEGEAASLRARAANLYGRLRQATPAAMGALIVAGERVILSNSPETLVDVRWTGDRDDATARSWPIKGTRPRHRDPGADAMARRELLASTKDLAEHVMIVDLVRNDLGRVARVGSVRAPAKPELVSLPTVHHLVSEVSCALRPGWTLRGLARALFPGGSVTGAPKRRTMELIDALEDVPRGIYCGAVVVLEPGGMRWSIPIRTGVLDREGLWLHGGGGVVADSDPEAERVETVVKTWAFDPPRDGA